jgi:hypothetical protein
LVKTDQDNQDKCDPYMIKCDHKAVILVLSILTHLDVSWPTLLVHIYNQVESRWVKIGQDQNNNICSWSSRFHFLIQKNVSWSHLDLNFVWHQDKSRWFEVSWWMWSPRSIMCLSNWISKEKLWLACWEWKWRSKLGCSDRLFFRFSHFHLLIQFSHLDTSHFMSSPSQSLGWPPPSSSILQGYLCASLVFAFVHQLFYNVEFSKWYKHMLCLWVL